MWEWRNIFPFDFLIDTAIDFPQGSIKRQTLWQFQYSKNSYYCIIRNSHREYYLVMDVACYSEINENKSMNRTENWCGRNVAAFSSILLFGMNKVRIIWVFTLECLAISVHDDFLFFELVILKR